MDFRKNPSRRTTACFRYARYTSLCRQYAVERATYLGGVAKVPDAWRALVSENGHWKIISRHRTRNAAERACQQASRKAASRSRRRGG